MKKQNFLAAIVFIGISVPFLIKAVKGIQYALQPNTFGGTSDAIIYGPIGLILLSIGLSSLLKEKNSTKENITNETIENLANRIANILASDWEPCKGKPLKASNNVFINNLSKQILEGRDTTKIAKYLTKHSKRSLVLEHDIKHDLTIAEKVIKLII